MRVSEKGQKHKVPTILDVKEGDLTREQIKFFQNHLDREKMDYEITHNFKTLFNEF